MKDGFCFIFFLLLCLAAEKGWMLSGKIHGVCLY
jgi:hypothetical protein